MFEAIHGSAPRRAGQNMANPSGLFLGAMMMLGHIGQPDVAERCHNAWLATVEAGIHTYDIFRDDVSKKKVGTQEFAQAVVDNLGKKPQDLPPVTYGQVPAEKLKYEDVLPRPKKKEIVGVDVFLDWKDVKPDDLGAALEKASTEKLKISMISNRGQKVWPEGFPETFCTDHWRCRFYSQNGPAQHSDIVALLQSIADAGYDFIKTEHLIAFDGTNAFLLGQGEEVKK
jgi:isocitrate dehydrogenase